VCVAVQTDECRWFTLEEMKMALCERHNLLGPEPLELAMTVANLKGLCDIFQSLHCRKFACTLQPRYYTVVGCHGRSCVISRTVLCRSELFYFQVESNVIAARLLLCAISSFSIAGQLLKQCAGRFTCCLFIAARLRLAFPSPPILPSGANTTWCRQLGSGYSV